MSNLNFLAIDGIIAAIGAVPLYWASIGLATMSKGAPLTSSETIPWVIGWSIAWAIGVFGLLLIQASTLSDEDTR